MTNALTDWEPPKDPKARIPIPMPELQEEKDAAGRIKRETPILVVLGNPPYNAFAGTVTTDEERQMIEVYKQGLNRKPAEGGWGIKKFNLDDLYVRFLRLAEKRIAEYTGHGIVCYITNFSYLNDPSFVVLRQRFLSEFDKVWIDNLNGDSRETGKLTPDGKPDPSVFSTSQHTVGIQVGTAVGLAVRRRTHKAPAKLLYRDFWGTGKRKALLDSLKVKQFDVRYTVAVPSRGNRYSFKPLTVKGEYLSWPSLIELPLDEPITGYKENRGFSLIDSDRSELECRMRLYYDKSTTWRQLEARGTGLTRDAAAFDARSTREKVLSAETFSSDRLLRYVLRPFEVRWAYYSSIGVLWNRSRPSLYVHRLEGNGCIITRPSAVSSPEGVPFYFTPHLADFDSIRGHAYNIPLMLASVPAQSAVGRRQGDLLQSSAKSIPNLSSKSLEYLQQVGWPKQELEKSEAARLWFHVLAVGFSPDFLSENADALRQDWPRVPLPAELRLLRRSIDLGFQIGSLLETDSPIPAITSGNIRPELQVLAMPTRVDGRALRPGLEDLDLTAGWGHAGKSGVTMPGKGRLVERDYSKDELAAIRQGAKALGLSLDQAKAVLGATTCDIYLNDVAYWKNVPKNVWEYIIGGYQVVKKWLSYREFELLGRGLTSDEVLEVQNMCRRIAAILLLQPALNANYEAIKKDCFDWSTLGNG